MTEAATNQPNSGIVTMTASYAYAYDLHEIRMSGATYKCFASDAYFEMKGQCFPAEEKDEQDYWTFNSSPDAKIIIVYGGGRDIYSGNIFPVDEQS